MKSDAERCAEYKKFKKIDAAFRAGDLAALRAAVDDPASERNLPALELLLEAGADPVLRTRIDDCETPREMAEKAGLGEIAELLAVQEGRLGR